jgi:hypothetical protein
LALARDEPERAARLAERLLRYDPGFVLLPEEESPPMQALFAAARARDASLRVEDLGAVCAQDGVWLVARAGQNGALEIFRYDVAHRQCTLAAHLDSPATESVATLLQRLLPPSAVEKPRLRKGFLIAAGVSWLVGVGLIGAGGYFAAAAASDQANVESCTPASTCVASSVRALYDSGQSHSTAAAALLSVGAGAIVLGALVAIGSRPRAR